MQRFCFVLSLLFVLPSGALVRAAGGEAITDAASAGPDSELAPT